MTLAAAAAEGRDVAAADKALPPGGTWIIDEASTVGTEQWRQLLRLADRRGAQIIAIGDPAQLDSVPPGGIYAALVARLDIPSEYLETVRRFRSPWEAKASLRLRAGDHDAVATYAANGRILGAGSEAGADIDAIAAMWAAATADDPPDGDLPAGVARIAEMRRAKREEARQQIADDDGIDPADVTDGDLQGADVLDTLVVATTHIEVDALNGALRDAARRGRPAPPDSDGVGIDWTDAHGTDHRWRYHVGDIVMTTDNDRTIRTTTRDTITNGRRWRITAISGDRIKLDSLDGQGAMELPAHYWKACDPKTGRPQLPHGYASTVYRSQGRTSDVALCLSGPALTAPGLYVGMTRGRWGSILVGQGTDADVAAAAVDALGRAGHLASASEQHRLGLQAGGEIPRRPGLSLGF